jgi:hypothetical protein
MDVFFVFENLSTAATWFNLVWEFSLVIYVGSTPVGNDTVVVANALTCNKHSFFN